jgi:hypothetical protein
MRLQYSIMYEKGIDNRVAAAFMTERRSCERPGALPRRSPSPPKSHLPSLATAREHCQTKAGQRQRQRGLLSPLVCLWWIGPQRLGGGVALHVGSGSVVAADNVHVCHDIVLVINLL